MFDEAKKLGDVLKVASADIIEKIAHIQAQNKAHQVLMTNLKDIDELMPHSQTFNTQLLQYVQTLESKNEKN